MALERPRFKIKATVAASGDRHEIKDVEMFYFVLQGRNGEVVATSELYPSRQEARDAAKRARLVAATASIGN